MTDIFIVEQLIQSMKPPKRGGRGKPCPVVAYTKDGEVYKVWAQIDKAREDGFYHQYIMRAVRENKIYKKLTWELLK